MKNYILPLLSIIFIALIFILRPSSEIEQGYTLGSQNEFTPPPTQRPREQYSGLDYSPRLDPFSTSSGFLAPKDLE